MVAVDASLQIDLSAVERANESAAILRRVGYDVRGAVGGPSILPEAAARAAQLGIIVVVADDLDSY